MSQKTLHVQNSLAPSIFTVQLLIAHSIKTNEEELYIAKPQNEARSDIHAVVVRGQISRDPVAITTQVS